MLPPCDLVPQQDIWCWGWTMNSQFAEFLRQSVIDIFIEVIVIIYRPTDVQSDGGYCFRAQASRIIPVKLLSFQLVVGLY